MRVALLSLLVCAAAACGGGKHGESICDNQVPPPAACMTACDPQPGAPNTCPAGYHCTPDGMCDAQCTPNGGQCGDGYTCTSDGQCQGTGQCQGLQCNIVQCENMGMPATTVSGTVYAPNGTLPLYGVTVYVPNSDPGPLADGAICNKCSDTLPGDPVVTATTDEAGHFTLTDVPSGANIPLVIVSGKWRRQITIPNVAQCTDNALMAADTRFPKNKTEGDIPKIAISTGRADSLECLIRKLGVDDSEIGKNGGPERIHLYTDANSGGKGVSSFDSGGNFTDSASTLWNDVNNLKPYDIVILSCEGGQYKDTKPKTAMDALKAYADLGGRVFLSHWHNIWIGGAFENNPGGMPAPDVWTSIAQWQNDNDPGNNTIDIIDETSNPKGSSFATWMQNVMGSTTRDQIPIQDGTAKTTASGLDMTKAERWTYLNNTTRPQNFQFTTPNEIPADQRCGKVAFSDMHVSGNSQGGTYPSTCGNSTTLSPQEKALAFMIFDLASCVGQIGRTEHPSLNAPVATSAK
jgi:hypothetical protein